MEPGPRRNPHRNSALKSPGVSRGSSKNSRPHGLLEESFMYEAIIFDLDGTLLDTLQDLANAMNRVLENWGLPIHAVEEYRLFVGDGVENLVRRALPENMRDPLTLSRGVAAMRKQYSRSWASCTRAYPGVADLLDGLCAKSVPMAILSNKPDDFTKQMVKTMLGSWKFYPVLGERPLVPRKPDPTGALEIATILRIEPERFLYLGDTDTDMKTAVAAGMYPVGALWGFRSAQELLMAGARRLVSKPQELLEFF